MTNDFYNVQVTYGLKDSQTVIDLKVKPGTTALKAIESSKIANIYPGIDLTDFTIGIYAKICPVDTILKEGDRVEIYRELLVTKKIEKTSLLKVEV